MVAHQACFAHIHGLTVEVVVISISRMRLGQAKTKYSIIRQRVVVHPERETLAQRVVVRQVIEVVTPMCLIDADVGNYPIGQASYGCFIPKALIDDRIETILW